ncbi:MAG: tRNA (N(6)-L-threonylcarbamoyladenosine(37)-C(2))-methylthiotransferase MtaB [Dehalogenimonas sp.]
MTKVTIETFGCKLNQAETETMRRQLSTAGYRVVEQVSQADVLIVNTCTVTHVADRKARQAIRAARKINHDIAVVVTGCYAERQADEIATLPGVAAVVGMTGKGDIAAEIKLLGFQPEENLIPPELPRTRSLIKIQDGCRHHCAYCIVPSVRPHNSCVPHQSLIEEITKRQADNYREIVLTGTEIGEYDDNGLDLTGLLLLILNKTSIERIRVSSLQPREVTPELIALWYSPRLCRHFHLSLQSGSDHVLKRMRRRYDTGTFRQTVELIRTVAPTAAITTDIIAGFPGETDAEFNESLSFIREIGFARLHIFPFSARPGTAAATMPDQVDPKITQRRVKQLLETGAKCETAFLRQLAGQSFDVLFEEKESDSWIGYTDNYLRVTHQSEENLGNRIVTIRFD